MFHKLKEYLANPNMSIWTALVCSVTAMTTDEWVALFSAFGLLVSTIFGLVQKACVEYANYNENKIQSQEDRELNRMNAENASERYKVETELMRLQISDHIISSDLTDTNA